jgi:hypothetical protein
LDDPAPIQFGVSVTDAWEAFRDPARRYVYAWHMDGGLNIAASEDKGLTLNVDAKDGEVRVAILDLDGNVIEGFGLADCAPIAIDALNAQVEWGRPAGEWLGNAVRPEIVMRNARLFAVNVE